jgi:eukaryotic-like serine/threonine-protein kinase
MPSDSVESFLDLARENRLLPTEQVQELVRRSEVPQANLPALCEALVARGLLTPFQANRIRDGRGRELAFAGYPILDDRGPCPGGYALTAKHPSLRTPIVLRRIATDWLAPADNLSAYIQRAQAASTVVHPHLATLLEAGAYEDQLFAVLEPLAGATLEDLVADIGPMPAFLACAYVRQAAQGLEAAHAAGHVHDDVRPRVLFLDPLVPTGRIRANGTPAMRPAPNAAVKIAELGLVPRRPALPDWLAARPVALDEWAYLPPERIAHGVPTPAGDVYGLGQSLAFLLTGRPPFPARTPDELLVMLRESEPLPLAMLRPDLPPALVELVRYLTARDPAQRPSLATTIERLAAFQSTGAGAPVPAIPMVARPADSSIMGGGDPVDLKPAPPMTVNPPIPAELVARPIDLTPVAAPGEWTVQPFEGSTGDGEHMYAPAAAANPPSHDGSLGFGAASTAPVARRREMSAKEAREQKKQWTLIAGGLWLLSIPLWIILLNTYGCFDSKKADAPGKPAKTRR